MNYAEIYQCQNIPIGWPGNRWDSKICHALETYSRLRPELRSCFLYFSILPEGSAMNKTDLCYLWVGDEIIPPVGNRLHYSTEECLGNLIDCELVQPICSNVRKRKPHSFTLHPSVHRLAVAMATESEFLTPDRELTSTSCSHACLKKINPTKLLAVSPVSPEGPASLFNLNATSFPPQYRIPYVYNLTALQLGGWSSNGDINNDMVRIEDPDFLDRCLMFLKNLRYLGLQGTSGIVSIPGSIRDLCRLRILNLSSCRDLEVLADGVANLSEMMVLDVSNCRKLKKMPAELLTKPKSLRVLKGLLITPEPVLKSLVPTGLFKFDHRVCPLLTKLAINIRPSQYWMANASKSLPEIKRITSLRSLTVSWDEGIVDGGGGKRYRPADAGLLWLPPNLEKLDLRCYPMEEAPAELASRRLKRLKKLYVQGGGSMTTMRALGRKGGVEGVEILRLADMTNLCMNWSELRRVFPDLHRAEIDGCPRIASFAGDASGVWTIEMDQTSIQGGGI